MRKKRRVIKSVAWLLCLAMMITLIPFPSEKIMASETVTNATDSGKPVYVSFELENSGTSYNQYKVFVNNNSGGTICDWEVTVSFASNPGFNAGWNGVSYDSANQIMAIQTYGESTWDNATIYTGESGSGAGFQIAAGALDMASVTLTYRTGVSVNGPATGAGNGDSGGSGGTITTDTTTNTNLDVEFNYAKLLQQSLYFYDANMCGALEEDCGVAWRGNCHTYDSEVTYSAGGVTYEVDASGGFHDAGDHVKFGLPQGYAASVLGMSYYQFKDAFDELKQTTHLQIITDYFCDYFKRCTVYKEGSEEEVIAFCYQVGNGDTDHAIWTAPESQTLERPAYFANSSNPATDQVSVAIAALALNYMNFGNEEDLKVAEDLFAFVKSNTLSCATQGCSTYYPSQSYGDDYATAAAALYIATGKTNNEYLNVYNTYKDDSDNGVNEYWVMDWANVGALGAMLMGDAVKVSNITKAGQAGTKLDHVFWCLSDWGSCRYNSTTQFVGLTYDKLSQTNIYTDWATSQMNYMIGDNPSKRCYAVGYNENSSQYPHHRAASRSTDASIIMGNHYTLLGALVGGPGSNGTYKDAQDDYYCNEVALDYNAGYVGALAGLYLAHKKDTTVTLSYAGTTTTNYSKELSTASELSAAGVDVYYGPTAGGAGEEDNPTEDDPVEEKTERTDTPSAPVLASRTAATIIINEEDGVEYSLDRTNWQTSGKFEGLEEFTKYTVYSRYKETNTYKAGPVSEETLSVYTLVEDPYTIDVSKLASDNVENYIDALRVIFDSDPTVTFADNILVLTGENTTYTLIGRNENLVIKLLSDSTILDVTGAVVGSVEKPQENGNAGGEENVGGNTNISTGDSATNVTEEKTPVVPVTGITITGVTKKVAPGKKIQLTATVHPGNATDPTVKWEVSNKKYASVSAAGLVKIKKAGKGKTVKVTASAADGTVKATYKIKIMKKAVKKIKVTAKKRAIRVGKSVAVKARFTPTKGISKEVTWTSSNPEVAIVNAKGKVTAIKKGIVKITAKANDGSGKKAIIRIRVTG